MAGSNENSAADHVRVFEQNIIIMDPAVVAAAMSRTVRYEDGVQQEGEREFTEYVRVFAATYHRATDRQQTPNENVDWHQELSISADGMLRHFADRSPQTKAEELACDTAALCYVMLKCKGNKTDWDADLLQRAGMSAEEVFVKFKAGVAEALRMVGHGGDIPKQVDIAYKRLENFAGKVNGYSWKYIIEPPANAMREQLLAEGYDLPELDYFGRYGDDDTIVV